MMDSDARALGLISFDFHVAGEFPWFRMWIYPFHVEDFDTWTHEFTEMALHNTLWKLDENPFKGIKIIGNWGWTTTHTLASLTCGASLRGRDISPDEFWETLKSPALRMKVVKEFIEELENGR